ncbi:phosphotransferase [Parasphingopyxis sp.]|uniref:phosphotransferase family protein n=1 Tax=Parasphingopyxis sp. TaxID=1920299 RepID=UPI00260C9ED4|nr:phosphotransferase [Parasphingopyxis sp.]
MSVIPTRPEQFTTAWLEEKIGAPTGSLTGFAHQTIGTGQMCDSFRLTLDWDGHDGPDRIVAKCPSTNPESRHIAKTLRNYTLEISWYRDLADEIPVACPPCYHAEIADDDVDFALLLGDMSPAQQGDQLEGADIPMIEAAIAEAAKLHAPLWDSPRHADYAWLGFGATNKELVRTLLPGLYQGFKERYRERLGADIFAMGDAFIARLDDYLDQPLAAPTIVHGDFRIDNILFHPETGAATVVDWQTVGLGSGPTDIAYLIGTSIADPEVRKAEEFRLLDDYAAQLRAQGVEITDEDCRMAYRRGSFSGFVMAIFASMNVERTERGDEMFAVMAERPAQQILDLNGLGSF